MKEAENQLYRATDEIMFYLWDPIGVRNIPAARDEYQSYLPKLFKMIVADAKDHEIAEYLFKLEASSMGMSGNKEQALKAARTLIEAKEFYLG